MWSHVLVWGCFYFSSRQGGSGAAADTVALQVPGNVSLAVLLEGFYTWMWEGLGTSEPCMPEDPLQCLSQPKLCLPPERLSKQGFLLVKGLYVSLGSDSDKWPCPSNMNFSATKITNQDNFICVTELTINTNSNSTPDELAHKWSVLCKGNLLVILLGIKEQQCGFLVYNSLFAFSSFNSD